MSKDYMKFDEFVSCKCSVLPIHWLSYVGPKSSPSRKGSKGFCHGFTIQLDVIYHSFRSRDLKSVYPFWVSKKNDETMIFIPQTSPFKPLIVKYFDRDPVGYAMIKTADNAVLSWSNLKVTPILRSLWSLQYLLKTPPSTCMGN